MSDRMVNFIGIVVCLMAIPLIIGILGLVKHNIEEDAFQRGVDYGIQLDTSPRIPCIPNN